MEKNTAAVILGAALLWPTLFTPTHAGDLADKYFSKSSPKLTVQERRALAIAQRWQTGTTNMRPFAGPQGSVQFVFGAQEPTVVCAVLQVCDVALQPGEQVNSIQLGDTARWNVEPAVSGVGPSEIQHLFIKPMDVGLNTSLVVTTDRRTYHIRLLSHRTKFMPQVSFSYPGESLAKWEMIHKREQQQRAENTIPATGEYLGNLSFNYDISGSAPWKPLRVYNDGHKTIIQMPKAMEQTEAPALLVVRKDGSLFKDQENVMVNYRVQGDRYIVDTVFDKAILISGVGSSQDKITIIREK